MTEKPSYEELERRVQGLKTESTQLENKLREARSLSEEIMMYMTEGLVLTDTRETVIFINQRLSEMLGYLSEEIIGKCWLDMVPVEQQRIAHEAKARRAHGHIDRYEIVLRRKNGEKLPVLIGAGPRFDKQNGQYLGSMAVVNDITERKQAEEMQKASEAAVRKKLKAIIEPESDLGELELGDIIDVPAVQSLMEKFHRITGMLSAIVDSNGKVLVNVGWQDICTKFHRCHSEAKKNCVESDTVLAHATEPGMFKSYRCKNGMWDMSSPIVVSGLHMGNIYFGQFVHSDEELDVERFRNQARLYGFDEVEYLAALNRVPRYDRETVQEVMAFYSKLGAMISALSVSNVRLSRTLTAQKRAEGALRESKENFRALFEKAPIGVAFHKMVYDDSGKAIDYRFLDANSSYLELTGVDPRGKYVTEAFPGIENDPFDWIGTFGRVAKTGEQLRFEQYLQPNKRWYDCVGYQVKPDYFVAAFVDITERKLAEAEQEKLQVQLNQAQKMESVGRLAGGVAHDFNNMLGVILGHTEMALEEIDPAASLHASLQAVQHAAERSAALTRQLLAFARKQTVAPKVIDLNDTVEGMLNMLRRLIGEDIKLVWQSGRNLPPVKVDPSQIDQLLANLCVNACDAIAGQGKITIETDTKIFDEAYCADHLGFQPGKYVLLEVSDEGCGMDKKTLSHIFEPFFTTKEQGKGTGLGLASVFGMVKQNNGFINVYSELGQGTTFKIYLPAYEIKTGGVVEKAPDLPAEHGNETILLVEDESAILQMTTRMLERLGYTVVAAITPGEAIHLAHEYRGRIDLLMTDVVMPEMNGRQLAGNLLSHYPDLKRLFMSGYTANVIAHHGVLDEGVHFIQKPFSMKDLGGKLREALKG